MVIHDLFAVAGVILVSIGAGLVCLPAGLIVFGVFLLLGGVVGHFRGGASGTT